MVGGDAFDRPDRWGVFISAMRRRMHKDFENKVALVTGASRGIGRAAAVRFAEGGAKVAIAYAGNDTAANEARAECERAGAAAIHLLKFDVANPEACAKAIDETVEKLGGLHVLVNNAGISIDGLLLRYKADDLRRVLDVDLSSAFHLCKAACKPMMKQRWGAIVNLTSVVGQGGADRVHQVAGAGAGEPEHPGQRREPGVDRDGHDEGAAGGGEEGDGRGGVARARGDGARGGGGHRVPGVGPRRVHYRGSAPGERRAVHVAGAAESGLPPFSRIGSATPTL